MREQLALILALASVASGSINLAAQNPEPLKLEQTIDLPGYSGDFDHFSIDKDRGRLLLAAEDHATLEVFDLKDGRHLRTVKGFDTPHSILIRPGAPTALVTDSGKSMSKLVDAETYIEKGKVNLVPGADSIGYDSAANTVYVVTGGKDVDMATSELAAVDPESGKKLGSVSFKDNHVEAMALEKGGNRLFINLAQTNKIAVVDRKAMKVLSVWNVPPAEQNAMVAFDEARHRLFVVCRKPGTVVVMNSDTGEVTSTQPAPLRADDVLLDATAHRLYVPGGEGYIGIYDTTDPDHLKMTAKVPSAPGAKTGILLADTKRLVLAASPGETKAMAKVLIYSIQ